ncbi:MAG: DUF58 domain-containing protein [Planctomycetota bacterium]
MKASSLSTLLPNDVLGRLERVRLQPVRRLTNPSRGEHLAGKGGSSTEFADYRDYAPGDDVRFVDWNIFSRLNKPYMKLYRHEEELHVCLIVDASASMRYGGGGDTKLQRACRMAAAFGICALTSVEKVSAHACYARGTDPVRLPPCTGRKSLPRLLKFLETIEPGGDYPIEDAVQDVLKRHRGRGIAVIASDFLTFGDVSGLFGRLQAAGLEPWAVQVMSPEEIDPDLTGDLRLVDCENGAGLDVTRAGDLLSYYQDHRLALEDELAVQCRQRGGRFLPVSTTEPLKDLLFGTLRRLGWLR